MNVMFKCMCEVLDRVRQEIPNQARQQDPVEESSYIFIIPIPPFANCLVIEKNYSAEFFVESSGETKQESADKQVKRNHNHQIWLPNFQLKLHLQSPLGSVPRHLEVSHLCMRGQYQDQLSH
uniref:Uncharacterized protein LOC8287159 n=1 Tax=Rhizophora mucronata TaxID=61149 RepID=A0A2P2MAG9_RHIMU